MYFYKNISLMAFMSSEDEISMDDVCILWVMIMIKFPFCVNHKELDT